MKKYLLLIILILAFGSIRAQTATNFTCNDCSGVSHDLFTELDAGKVIVIDWVMPCASCVGPTLTSYNIVQSYQASHPGRVFFYMVDDYANTACVSLNSWANSINVPQNAFSLRFVNAAINMQDYGSSGMPKIVVLGGTNHTVFYNADNVVNATAMQNAINAALSSTSIEDDNSLLTSMSLFPNPADKQSEIRFYLNQPATVTVELYNMTGKKVQEIYNGGMNKGEQNIPLNTGRVSQGMYLVKLTVEGKSHYFNLIISR